MSLELLTNLVPPPAEPRGAAGDWAEVERRLGLWLPGDYRQIVGRYGAGAFADFLIVLNPFVPNAYLNLERGGNQILEAGRALRRDHPGLYPIPLHPEPGGLFPWAVTEAGDTLLWRTAGDPDGWSTVLRRSNGTAPTSHPFTASAFLVEWLGRRSLKDEFGDADAGEGAAYPEFIPFRKTYLLTAYFAPSADEFDARLSRLMRHFGARRLKSRLQGLHGFNQCSFRGGTLDVLIVYLDDAEFGSRLELHVPRAARAWAETTLARVPAAAGIPFRRPPGAAADFTWVSDPNADGPEEV